MKILQYHFPFSFLFFLFFSPLFLSSTHVVPHFFFSLFFLLHTHTLTLLFFYFFPLLQSINSSKLRVFQFSFFLFFFFFFSLFSQHFLSPFTKNIPLLFSFLFSFFPLFFLYSFLLFVFPRTFHKLTELSFSHSFFFFLAHRL